VLFFIELGSRRVHLAGCTTNPSGAWVAEQAGNLSFAGLFDRMRFLTRDRDNKFSAVFDEVFRSEGIRVIHTPIRAPQANAYAERFVRTTPAERLDSLLILGRRRCERVLGAYSARYNRDRPHPVLALHPVGVSKLSSRRKKSGFAGGTQVLNPTEIRSICSKIVFVHPTRRDRDLVRPVGCQNLGSACRSD
jgi:Integrase core domain